MTSTYKLKIKNSLSRLSGFAKVFLTAVILLLVAESAFAQIPANDEPCNAITLTPAITCTYQTFTNANATASPGVPAPGCASYQGGDVWFQVTVPAGGVLTIDSQTGTITDGGMAIYSGTCSNLVLISCDDDSSPNGLMPLITATGLVPGSTLWIRFWEFGGDNNGTFGICVKLPAPPPFNDDCNAATNLTVNPDFSCAVTTPGSTESASASTAPAATCSATGTNDDVWFQFTATGPSHVVSLSNVVGTVTAMSMALYSGSCTALTQLQCNTTNSMTVTGLTAGQVYTVRVWTTSATASAYAAFNICVGTPPPPPANDDCNAAVNLTVNPDLNCAVTTNGTTASATASTAPAPTCGITGVNDDVWYRFTATGTSHQVTLTGITGNVTAMSMALYSGACTALTHLQCATNNTLTVQGLTVGQVYYVRVWTTTATVGSFANFTICVGTPPPPPANDDCAAAVNLTVNPDLNCAVTANGTTLSATPSTAPVPTCSATGINDDVWYKFTATGIAHVVTLTGITGNVTAMSMALYSGNCTTPIQFQCVTNNTLTVGGLTAGQTYFVRVWTTTATVGSFSNFTICVGTPPPPPANDEPCNAIILNVAQDGQCTYQNFTNASATASPNVPAPGCANYQGGDVWFKLVIPCTGSINLDSQTGVITDGGMAIYTGSCNSLTLVECDDDDSPNGLMPAINRSGLTPGDTLYIRFWEFGNDNNGSFGICATVPPPAGPSSSCGTATAFCSSTTPTSFPNVTGQPNTNGGGIYGCLATIPNPNWFYLQIQNPGTLAITISQMSNGGAPTDVDFVCWGPFTNLATACSQISANNIIDCSYSTAAVEILDIPNALVGQFYILLVTNFNGSAGTITYQQTGGTASTNCAISCTLDATNNGPICAGSTVNLFASNVTNATYMWTGPNCYSSTSQNPTGVTPPQQPGTYVYTVTATGPNGQNCSDTTRVTVLPAPNIGADTTRRVCAGSTVNLTTLYSGAGLTFTYQLNGVNVTNPAAVGVSGFYQVIASLSGISCRDTAIARVIIDTVAFTATAVNGNCTTPGSIKATTTSGIAPFTYAISTNPTVFQTSDTFNVSAGTYTITVRDSLGCTATRQVTVTQTNNLSITGTNSYLICRGASTALNLTSNGTSFSWSPSTGLSNPNILNPTAAPTQTTTYTLTATLGSCTRTYVVTVNVNQGVTVNAGPDIIVLAGEQGTLLGSATGGVIASILWSPTTGLSSATTLQPTVSPAASSTGSSTTYTLSVTNDQGCVGSDDAVVTVVPYCINVKNAFTPNGDGINDRWLVYGQYSCLTNVTVHIFNRYGSKVFESRDYRNTWDGNYNGKPLPDGTYYAVAEFTVITGRKFTIKSDVTILR